MPWSAVWAFSQPLVLAVPEEPLVPRYNISPTQEAWVIAGDGQGGAKAGRMRWGLVPHWAADFRAGVSTFNARLESAATKPTFRQAFERRHCLVPASGYYEWVGAGKDKRPWYIRPFEAPMMFFAGLWDRWQAPDGTTVLSFTVLTQGADGELAKLHDRRPVVLSPSHASAWLAPARRPSQDVLMGSEVPPLQWHAVGQEVGNARAEGQHLIAPLPPER